jgi:DNA-directed RNA polymerase subunit RPC12/RpoP
MKKLSDFKCHVCSHETEQVPEEGATVRCPRCCSLMGRVKIQKPGKIHYDRTVGPKS